MRLRTVARILALPLMYAWSSTAFSFSFSNPTQCDDLEVSWTGGTPPFNLLVTPLFGVPQNIAIPDNTFSNGKGTFATPLTLSNQTQFLLTMSDSTGFNAGGSSTVLTVGNSLGGSCNTTVPHVPFDYQTPSPLLQCLSFTFSSYVGAIQPVTIYAIIPGGDALTFHPPKGPTSFDWTAKVASGNDMVFLMVDALGRQGGSSALKHVEPSDSTNCLSGDLPTTTSGAPSATNSPTSTGPPSSTGTSLPDQNDNKDSGSKTAVIVGTLAGCLIAFACVASLGFFFWKKRNENRDKWSPYSRNTRRMQSVDLLHQPPPPPPNSTFGQPSYGTSHDPGSRSASSHNADPNYAPSSAAGERTGSPFDDPPYLPPGHQPEPFMLAHPTQAPPAFAESFNQEEYASLTSPTGTGEDGPTRRHSHTLSTATATTAARRKAQMAGVSGYNAPSRFILHTDIDDVQPNEDGFIELPPQYTPGRRPTQREPPEAGPHGTLSPVAEGQTPSSSTPFPTSERYQDAPP